MLFGEHGAEQADQRVVVGEALTTSVRRRFATGDLGGLDGDGRLHYSGRRKDMFKVGGENVAASEIELVLAEHPAVTFAHVVSVPDPRLTEVPVAFVELRPGERADAGTPAAFCADGWRH